MKKAFATLALITSAIVGLPSCMPSGISSAAKLAALSPLDADPGQFRVALVAPAALRLKAGDARLGFGWAETGKLASSKIYDLEIVPGTAAVLQSLPPLQSGQQVIALGLAPREVEAVLKFQQEVRDVKQAGRRGSGNISVSLAGGCWSEPFPADGKPLPLDIWLQPSAGGEYLPIMRGVDLRAILKKAGLTAVPQCTTAS
ncbi:hypothetical protein DFR48_10394 [Ciceribacter lividus]|uniref:Group 4 capsule polysaccharide lipoprotein GfcB/YjbF n=1 Tax=Ciceribacter lividus TaxID=1197950 RepID=A0A6I7HQ93_9HYPH|nr:hypothetical protein [Ciceribacter lividus]RCW27137.1 hypothetical protein DFR48_10394 [Ciceribacter lividus]